MSSNVGIGSGVGSGVDGVSNGVGRGVEVGSPLLMTSHKTKTNPIKTIIIPMINGVFPMPPPCGGGGINGFTGIDGFIGGAGAGTFCKEAMSEAMVRIVDFGVGGGGRGTGLGAGLISERGAGDGERL